MMATARGTFDIKMEQAPPELEGAVNRYDFTKTFHGDLVGSGAGVMLSCGDPESGAAGYVAIETVRGRLGDRSGSFALQQLGMISGGSSTLHYQVVPGSGQDALKGITGTLQLTISPNGRHDYELAYEL